ncbi:MAG: hypothetical protein Q9163_000654 [Psora crenata]
MSRCEVRDPPNKRTIKAVRHGAYEFRTDNRSIASGNTSGSLVSLIFPAYKKIHRTRKDHPLILLPDSEFPSLSGNSQPQYQNSSQAIWQQRAPVQRPQQPQTAPGHQPQNNQSRPDPSSPSNDDMFIGSSHLQGSLDDYRRTAQGQMPGPRQAPSTSIDDFPPLGRNGTDGMDEQRGGLIQSGAFGSFSNQNAFSPQQDGAQSRQGLPTNLGQPGTTANGRSPIQSSRVGQDTIDSLLSTFTATRGPSSQQQTNHQQSQAEFEGRVADLPPPRQKIEEMNDRDRYGIAGLVSKIKSDDPMVAGQARGQDLTQLGLNLHSHEPLYPTWTGPFAGANARPMQPDFQLPDCYTVTNVHRVREKLPGFSDETLFWIFYTQPRDILQELAATEL